jgi:mRNA-degrading endonuclease toxin of MazEF toxin-antitoxin module
MTEPDRVRRGQLWLWSRNRSFGDAKSRPVLLIAPDAATRVSARWVVLPLSTDPRLALQPLALSLPPTPANGLDQSSFVLCWLPTTVSRELLSGPLGRVSANDLRRVLQTMATAMDLEMLEPWEP